MKDFFRKNAAIGVAEILGRLPLIFTVGFLAASVGTEAFGNWALILAFQAFLAGVAGLGLSSSLSRLASVSPAGVASGYLRFALLLCSGTVLAAGALALQLRQALGVLLDVAPAYRDLLPIAVLISAGGVVDGLLDAFFKAREAVGRQIAFISTRTLAEVTAVVATFALQWPGLDTPFRLLATYVIVLILFKALAYPWLLMGTPKAQTLGAEQRTTFLHYGLPMVPSMVVIWFVGQGDRLILSHFIDKHALGIYAFGASLAGYLVFLGYAIYPLLLPRASRLHEAGNDRAVAGLFQESQRLFLIILTIAMITLALVAKEVIGITAGQDFAGAEHILVVLGFAVCVEQLLGVYQYVFHLVRRTDWILWLNLLYGSMLVSMLAMTAHWLGASLVPWAVLAATVAFNFIRYRAARHFLPIVMPVYLVPWTLSIGVVSLGLHHATADWPLPGRLVLIAVLVTGPVMLLIRGRRELGQY